MDPALALNAGVALAVALVGFGCLLALVSVVAWRRLGRAKLLVVGGAFAVLALKGGLAVWTAYAERRADLADLALDAAVLGFLYASVSLR